MPSLLEVRHLSVTSDNHLQALRIISDVSFSVERGECLIVLGESGGGKTILTRALTRLFLPVQPFKVTGEVVFDGVRLEGLSGDELNQLRKRSIRYIFQEPSRALNPLMSVGAQMALAGGSRVPERNDLAEALTRVGILDAESLLRSFPHQLSVGMAQRVLTAMALLPGPELLIADEPTSAIDEETRNTIVDLLRRRQKESAMAMIVTTHDIEIAKALGQRIVVILRGKIVEGGPAEQILMSPFHPYVKDFVEQAPAALEGRDSKNMSSSGNDVLPTMSPGSCCAYAGRCRREQEVCRTREPDLEAAGTGREVRCFFWK